MALRFKFDECGSSVSYFHDVVVINNEILVHKDFSDTPLNIVFDADYKIPITCNMNRSVILQGAIQTVTHDPIKEVEDKTEHKNDVKYIMKEFKTEDYREEITAFPVQIPINREVFLELSSDDQRPDLGIEIEECIATPTTDPKDPVSYALVRNGCPVSPAVHLISSSTVTRRRFKLQAFHFSGKINDHDKVFFHCRVKYCLPYSCDTSRCYGRRKRSGARSSLRNQKRKKNNALSRKRRLGGNYGPDSNVYVSLGPFTIVEV